MLSEYINGDPVYTEGNIPIGTVPTILAIFPLLYHIPTIYVTMQFLSVYSEITTYKNDNSVNPSIMFIMVLHQCSATCMLIGDYLNFRIPATGLVTKWCASQPPSHVIKVSFWISIYFYYLSMIFPLLLAILRLVPIYKPMKHLQINGAIIKYTIPVVLAYPLAISAFLFPARGVCRQHPPPYAFGAVHTHFIESWNGITNSVVLIVNLTLWLTMAIVANLILYRKLKQVGSTLKQSRKYQKSEMSLTLTTISMLVSFVANLVFLIAVVFFTDIANFLVMVRSIGGDFDAVVVPWIFFLMHPVFRKRAALLKRFTKRINIVADSS